MKNNFKVVTMFILTLFCFALLTQDNAKAVDNTDKVTTKGITRGASSFNLTSEVSVSELTNYTDTATINFNIHQVDSNSGLYNGKLVIDLSGKSFELRSFQGTANSRVKKAVYDRVTKILTVDLISPIETGTIFDYSITVSTASDVNDTENMSAKATLSGNNNSATPYTSETNTTKNVLFNSPGSAFEPIDPANPQWKFNGAVNQVKTTNISLSPGNGVANGLYATIDRIAGSNSDFTNLRIEYTRDSKLSGTANLKASRLQISNAVVNGTEIENSDLINNVEYGMTNSKVNNKYLYEITSNSIPSDAVTGDVYKNVVKVFDGDSLITTWNINITVIDLNTNVTFNSYAKQSTVLENDYFDWAQRNSITTGGIGVKDYTVTLDIPNGTVPISFNGIEGMKVSNSLPLIKKFSVYSDDSWIDINPIDTTNSAYNIPNSIQNITKVKYIYNNIANFHSRMSTNDVFLRLKNVNNSIDDTINLNVESVTYIDHNDTSSQKTLDASNNKGSVKVVEKLGKPSINASVSKQYSDINPFTIEHFNGDKFIQYIRLFNFNNKLKNPYAYQILPQGVIADTTAIEKKFHLYIADSNGLMSEHYKYYSSSIIQPKSDADIEYKQFTLEDGRTLQFWFLKGGDLSSPRGTMGADFSYKLISTKSGTHDFDWGFGSLDDDTFDLGNNADGVLSSGVTYGDIPTEVKTLIPELTATKQLSVNKKLVVASNNSVTTKMEIKGSEDAAYKDAASNNATSIPGKQVNYRLSLTNAGTNDLKEFQAVDILPHVGDKLTTNSSVTRDSEFNVNLGGTVKVLVDGVESLDAFVEYTTSNDPQRYDIDGDQIGTGTWGSAPSDLSSVKAIKVSMPSEPFKTGSTIQLEFIGTLPTDAPRGGELAYNTIAIKAMMSTVSGDKILSTESAKGAVKSTAPATDLELSGSTFMDFDKSGAINGNDIGYNGVTLNLYKKSGSVFTKVDTITTAPNSSSVPGKFAFTGMSNGTYKIEAELKDNSSFVTTGVNSFEVQTDISKAWLKFNGNVEFSIDDLAGVNPKKITTITAPFYVTTPFSGIIKFIDKDGVVVTGNTFGKDFNVQLQNAAGTSIAGSSAVSVGDGTFSIAGIEASATADYKLEFTKPSGKAFVYPASNGAGMNTTSGVYTITGLVPGNAGIADILISDTDLPSVTVVPNKLINPTSIPLTATDATTTASTSWVTKLNDTQINAGTGAVVIPTNDGTYTIEAIATDSAKNVSTTQTATFTIDKTKPVIVIDSSPVNNTNLTKLDVSATDTQDTAVKISYVLTNTKTGIVQNVPNVTGVQDLTSKIGTDGVYTLAITAVDSGGNAADPVTKNFTIDKTNPIISIDSLPTTNINLTKLDISVTDNLDTAAKISYVLTNTKTSFFQTSTNVTGPQNLMSKIGDDGTYTLVVDAKDSAGNNATQVSKSFTIDKTKPVVSVNITPTTKINPTAISVDVTDNIDTAAKISYVLKNTTTNTDMKVATNATGLQNLLTFVTNDGNYSIVANAVDAAGNNAIQVTETFIKDTTKPVVSVDIGPTTKINPTKLEVKATDNLDTAPKISYTLTNTTKGTVAKSATDETGLQNLLTFVTDDGNYSIVANAVDAAGNQAVSVTETFKKDTTEPVVTTSITSKTIKVGTSSIDLKTAFTAAATDALQGSITSISVVGTYNLNVPGSYPLTFTATDDAGNVGEKDITLVVEQIEISGIVYNDINYNSIKDDTGVIAGIDVQLVNNDTDALVATSTTDSDGKYSFKLPGTETVSNYSIKVSDTKGYLLANKGTGSILDLTTLKSSSMIIQGSDYLDQNIGLASDISASIAPLSTKVYLGDTITNSVSLTNGTIHSATLDNTNVAITSVTGGYDIEGLVLGDSVLTVVFKDGYVRNSVTKTQNIKVIPIPKVTFDTKGGSTAPTALEVKAGVSVDLDTIQTPTYKGFVFKGWYNEDILYKGTFLMPETDLTLTADWTPVLSADGGNEKFSGLNIVSPASSVKNITIALVKAQAKPNIYLVDENNVKSQNVAVKNIDKSKVQAKQGSYPLYIISESGQKHMIYVSVGKTISPKTNASSALDSSNFSISLKDFNKFVKNKTIQQEIIKKSYTKSWDIKSNKPVGKISVSYTKPNKAGKFKITIKANALSVKSAATTSSDELTNEVTMTVTNGPIELPDGGTNTILIVLSILSSITLVSTRLIKRKA